jgi:hypothetical protein
MKNVSLSGLLILAAGAALAQAPGPAFFTMQAGVVGGTQGVSVTNGPGPVDWADIGDLSNETVVRQSVGSAHQTTGPSPGLNIQVTADVVILNGFPQQASAGGAVTNQIVYSMVIAGPANQLVPVRFMARAQIDGAVDSLSSSTAFASANAAVNILCYGAWQTVSRWNQPCPAFGACTQNAGSSFTVAETFDFVSGAEYLVTLYGEASNGAATSRLEGPLSAHSEVGLIIDPTFAFVDPADAEIYSFTFSPNLVPLPPTAWMLGAGLVLLGWRIRGRVGASS